MKFCTLLLFLCSFCIGYTQQQPTSGDDLLKAVIQKKELQHTSIVKNIHFKNIGPSIMSGRVVDLAVNPDNPTEFYVAYASGGLWYTNNNGTSFEPVMDTAKTINIGDIAVDWKNKTIWVGTGENNSSRSSYAGIGILKSTDLGKSWEHKGLSDSHHIGKIIINPKNPDEVIVGSMGHLYSSNNERGIYKTTDGGKSWKKTLFINDQTGIIDIAHAPGNSKTLYASAWQRDRKAWNFTGNGPGSGIYKSTDSGDTWTKISSEESKFPQGKGVGRIGLGVYDENRLYAVVDNQFRREEEKKKKSDELKKEDFKELSKQEFLQLGNKKIDEFLKSENFPKKYTSESVKELIRAEKIKPEDIALYLESANTNLFETPVIGAEVYRSDDGGKTWIKTHNNYLDDIYYSYGYYFGQIHVNPKNKNHIYIYGVPILKSTDGGTTFSSIDSENVHADHHALWINPKNPNHLINGNDGGVNISYDAGAHWIKANQPAVGQFYSIAIDHESPYNVYGGLQDNGVWVGKNTAKENTAWHQSGQYPWKSIMGGDGMQVEIDKRNAAIVYTGFQFGNYYRIDREKNETTPIQPKHDLGEPSYRFNWQTPILLSPHNQDILYLGANKLMRSMNQGKDWTTISEDLTQGAKKGNVSYGTLTTISESPFQFGLLYTGSDDGKLYVSKNGGADWTDISKNLPQNLWVSRVVASSHQKNRVYASLNGYRRDDFTPYLYKSNDYGLTWQNIGTTLPLSPVNVIKEDPENPDILYVGTDNSAYVSLDRGTTWNAFDKNLPPVAVHDLVIQPEASDLLLGTHGRSIYKTSIKPLQLSTKKILASPLHVFPIDSISFSEGWGESQTKWSEPKEELVTIPFYTKSSDSVSLQVLSEGKKLLKEMSFPAARGFNYIDYNLSISDKGKAIFEKKFPTLKTDKKSNDKYYLPPGTYQIKLMQGEHTSKTKLKINEPKKQ